MNYHYGTSTLSLCVQERTRYNNPLFGHLLGVCGVLGLPFTWDSGRIGRFLGPGRFLLLLNGILVLLVRLLLLDLRVLRFLVGIVCGRVAFLLAEEILDGRDTRKVCQESKTGTTTKRVRKNREVLSPFILEGFLLGLIEFTHADSDHYSSFRGREVGLEVQFGTYVGPNMWTVFSGPMRTELMHEVYYLMLHLDHVFLHMNNHMYALTIHL